MNQCMEEALKIINKKAPRLVNHFTKNCGCGVRHLHSKYTVFLLTKFFFNCVVVHVCVMMVIGYVLDWDRIPRGLHHFEFSKYKGDKERDGVQCSCGIQ